MNDLLNLIQNHQWFQISQKYQPKEIAKKLPFKKGMLLGYHLLLNEQMDDDLREFAVELINEIRKTFPEDWNRDWRNDIFLGDAFYLTMKYEERYESYKRAFDKISPAPPALLVSMAGCYTIPGFPVKIPITIEEAEKC